MGSFYRKLDETQSAYIPFSIFCAMVMQRNCCATSTRNNAAITLYQSLDWLHRNLIKSSFVFLSIEYFVQLCYIHGKIYSFLLSSNIEKTSLVFVFFFFSSFTNIKDANLLPNYIALSLIDFFFVTFQFITFH